MNKNYSKKMHKLWALYACLIISFCFCGCGSEREYFNDICITLQDPSEKLIIKEWRYLQGSGIEVYYQKNVDKAVLLGKSVSGDDGFCPFNEGLYEIEQNGNIVTITWCFNPSNKDKTNWRSKDFEIPV